MNAAGIYRIRVDRGEKPPAYYFGQSAQLKERWRQHLRHLRAGRHDNVRMQSAFKKYGEEAFSFSLILICAPTKETMTLYEQHVLDFYFEALGDRLILNVMRECVISHLGVKRRPETIERMSKSQAGRKKSPEHVAAIKAARPPGFHHSDESKAMMSAIHKAIPPHPNSIAALEAARNSPTRLDGLRAAIGGKPKIHSPETIQKISIGLTGKTQSDETKAKKSAKMSGRKQRPQDIATRVASRKANAAARGASY
jgi:group I intron endonuclease